MRIGIFSPMAPDTIGGGYTFEHELFERALEYASTSKHEFVVFEGFDSSGAASKFLNFKHVLLKQPSALTPMNGYQWENKWIADILTREGIEFFVNTSPEIAVLEIPYLAIVWDLQHRLQPFFPEVSSRDVWQIRENFFSNVLKRATFVVTGTQAGKNEIHLFYGIADERIRILPHPTPRFALEARPANVAELEKYRLPRDYVFYPAQFWSHKNHVGLLRALVRLKETDNLRLPVVFTGSDQGNEDYVRQTVRTLRLEEQVHFLGHVPRETLVALYQNAFVLCYPSFFGPENLPPLEAFALGCPVIAANVPGVQEQLGDAATLVNPADELEIAQALKSLLFNKAKREELIRRGKKRARRFTGSDFAKGLFALLDEFQQIRRCWSVEPQAASGSTAMDDQREMEAKERVIQAQNRDLEAKENVIQAQNRDLEAKENVIQAQNRDLEAKENVIQAQNGELKAREEIIQRFQTSYLFWISEGPFRWVPGVRLISSRLQSFHRMFMPKVGVLEQYPAHPLFIPKMYLTAPEALAGKLLPSVSIVTPSYNQGEFIERTIWSVLDQEYPHLEYIVQDGNSKDGTLDILKSFQQKLTYFESRPDNGNAHAINLGFQRTSGEIMAFLNSDDILLPGALRYVADYFTRHPEVDVIYSHRVIVNEQDQEIGRWVLPPHDHQILLWADYVPQETLFWRRSMWERIGGHMDESFPFALDWDLLIRFQVAGAKFKRLPRFLAAFRLQPKQKTSTQLDSFGVEQMNRLRKQVHGREIGSEEVNKNIAPYLQRSIIYHNLYRLGIIRY